MGRGGGKNLAADILYGRSPLRSSQPEIEPKHGSSRPGLYGGLEDAGVAKVSLTYDGEDQTVYFSHINLWDQQGQLLDSELSKLLGMPLDAELESQAFRLLQTELEERSPEGLYTGVLVIDVAAEEMQFGHEVCTEEDWWAPRPFTIKGWPEEASASAL